MRRVVHEGGVFPETMTTVCSHYFIDSVKGAARQGKDERELFRLAGVDPILLTDPSARGEARDLARLIQTVWRSLDDEFMGFTGRQAKVGLFGLMTRFIVASESLEGALRAGTRFYNLIREDVHMGLEVSHGEATFETRFTDPGCDPEHYFQELWLAIWHRMASWLTGGPVPLLRAKFNFPLPAGHMEDFKYRFPCRHEFDAGTNAFVFDADYLRMPVIRSRPEVHQLLIEAPLEWLTMPVRDNGIARQVRTALLPRKGQPVEFPTIDVVAGRFHMTPQTLRRRLKDESTSYRVIKENIRRDIAITKVLHGNTAIEDIAFLVGYSETRAFTRAFHQWTGLSPMKYRQQHYRPLDA